MKLKIFIVAMLASLSVQADDMQKYLSDTQDLVKQGAHQEALERYLWFHDHALEHERSMTGVRLSFALSYWKKLGEVYPPALDAMTKVRNEKSSLLEEGKGSYDLFVDVRALNRTLEENDETVALFRKLDQEQEDLAKKCWDIAKEAVIKEKAYDLARKYIGNPVREFSKVKASYDRNVSMYGGKNFGDHFKAFNENNFVEKTIRLIDVAVALDDMKAAKEIQSKALAILDDYRLQDVIPSEKETKQDAQPVN